MQRKRHKENNVRIPHSGECGAGHIPAIGGRDNISAQVWCIKQDGSELVRDRNDPVRSFCLAAYRKNVAAAGRRTYTIGSSASLRWVGGDRQLPRPSAHPSATEQVLAGTSRSPFSASAGTKV